MLTTTELINADPIINSSKVRIQMKKNVGVFDRIVRVIVGVMLIGYAVLSTNVPYSYFGWVGLIAIATAFIGYCPLYSVLGVSTNERVNR
jgi:hypothetical protein